MSGLVGSSARMDRASKLRIVVLGYIVRGPLGGLAWHHLQYVLGLARLGHEVYFVEDSEDYESCYDPSTNSLGVDPTYGLGFAESAFEKIGLGDRWAYFDWHTQTWHGPAATKLISFCSSADLLLNVSGVNPIRPWMENIPVRVLIDTDPVFTQIRHLTQPSHMQRAREHTRFLSFGTNIELQRCSIPDDGFRWRPTRQPVVLEAWPLTPGPSQGPFTTVMQWDSYARAEYRGVSYGMKSESFEAYLTLPERTGSRLELALGSEGAPRDELRTHGWLIRDPLEVTLDPWTYQRYLQTSKAEFSVCKHGYVTAWTGWFSERSACYLASGRPVLVQDTGYTEWLPGGEGLISFSSPQEALEGIDLIEKGYERHCAKARELASEFFDSDNVLSAVISLAMNGDPEPASQREP